MTNLIDKLERADGLSDELDAAIAEWCYANRAAGVNYDPEMWLLRNGGFTDSVDAAMTLAVGLRVREITQHVEMSRWYVELETPDCVSFTATGRTMSTTIAAAALRARSQGGE